MQNILFCFLVLFTHTSLRPGESVATLTCKSVSGKTLLNAEIPGCAYIEKAEFSIDGSKLLFVNGDNSSIIFDPSNKVFTMELGIKTQNTADKFLKFWAIPSSFKKTKNEKRPGSQFHEIYEFHAKVYATEPRTGFERNTKTIELICTLDYQL